MYNINRKVDPFKPDPRDWHRADIKAAVAKAGWTMQDLSRTHGYVGGSLRVALRMPWPKAEAIIAAAIGVPPQIIWPSRYRPDGSPKSSRNERGIGRYKSRDASSTQNKQYSDCDGDRNVKDDAPDRQAERRNNERRAHSDRRGA